METLPDVLGYKIEDAILLLESNAFKINVKESIAKTCVEEGCARVIRSKRVSQDEIELIISYF
ncbi:PASTA domain-containing protein [Clostridium formicaceticum]|uniref:Uncharacterized protein n=1 Tax=Clostridium formicaceticum TaxID=1497 RepID=A0AAC9WGH5_9CLOT|nr:PASTA domain-containing protein [Clostridium formicaceticum]AOY77285.1 hypothetical protein BJL90_16380 [Clostridium formicaceticum]ARE87826.1 hypothetical protein CLFO_22260 [Clostridium formicaceticum]